MGLSRGEAAALLSIINAHHGNAPWTDLQLDVFHSELLPSMTADEAREAVRRFYATNAGRWCGSADINRIVRSMRDRIRPSEYEVTMESERFGLNPEQSWMYRRQRMLGRTPETAVLKAREWHPQLEAAKPKQKPRDVRRNFNPKLGVSLAQVLSDTPQERV